MSTRRPLLLSVLALLGSLLTVIGLPQTAAPSAAATLPSNFQEQVVFSGLNKPTNLVFAPDGRIFVAEKGGVIKVYDSLTDPTPDIFADLSTNTQDYTDRGLLGLAVPPNFPANPYVYVLYSFDAPIGGNAPTWGDGCPTPPGTTDGCVISGRLSRLKAAGNHMSGTEEVLLNDWCQQFFTHSVGSVEFGPDGALYVSGGDGASPTWADYGQAGTPQLNPCNDPPGGLGGTQTAPTAEGGALRSQAVRATDRTHTPLNGTIIRIDPKTAAPLADNPWYTSGVDANTKRIVAYGLRNPYRITFRPGTNEIWAGDVGWRKWEEINRIGDPKAAPLNFGWPCYEGDNGGQTKTSGYSQAGLNLCTSLYANPTKTVAPYYAYTHTDAVVAGDNCEITGSSPTGLAFYQGALGAYPAKYDKALFFADYARSCIWAMLPGANGLPDKTKIELFDGGAATPTDLTQGPGGDLFYADINGGTIRRIVYSAGNQPPTARATANPTSGTAPLAVQFDGSASSDPDAADALSYQWDLDNNGTVDSTLQKPSFTYQTNGSYTAKLTVTDPGGLSNSTTVAISAGVGAPTAVIDTPLTGLTWKVGDPISFTGHATSPQQAGNLPATALHWRLRLEHCATVSECHTHYLQEWDKVPGGSFVAPDHDYPSHLELDLTATDSGGRTSTTTVVMQPKTAKISLASNPPGLSLTTPYSTDVAPFDQTIIAGSANTISAASPQTLGGNTYTFVGWSDGGAQTHVVSPTADATYTATFQVSQNTGPALSGTALINGTTRPLAGANVTLDPGGWATTTSATGTYSFDNVPDGNYAVTISQGLGRCVIPNTASVTVAGPTLKNVAVTALHDDAGYTCVDAVAPAYTPGTVVTGLTGDDKTQQITLPFAFPYYGQSYTSLWADTNGMASFTAMPTTIINRGAIPSTATPNTGIYPFWADLVMDATSSLRTATVDGKFVLDWNNAYIYGSKSHRLNFEAILSPNGDIEFRYQYLDARPDEQGVGATVGLENGTGTVALQYAFHETVLRDTISVTFRKP